MAVAFKSSLGTAVGTAAGATTLVLTTTAAIDVGDLVVVRASADNYNASAPTFTCADSGGNSYTVHSQRLQGATATAGTGVGGAVMCAKATTAIAAGGTITLTVSNSLVQNRAFYAESFTGVENTVRSAAVGAGAATGNATVTSGTVNSGDLVIGAIAVETRASATGDADTTNGAWSTIVNLPSSTGGSDATRVLVAGQYKIATASGAQTYNTTNTSVDWAAFIVVLQASPDPSITQAAYQFFDDTGTESGAAALAAQNTAVTGNLANGDGYGQIRVRLQSTTAVAIPATDDFMLQWEKNASGSWNNAIGESLADTYASSNFATGTAIPIISPVGSTALAQSFLGNGQPLTKVGFWLAKQGTPTGNITASLYAHTGTYGSGGRPTGSALATSSTTLSVATIAASPSYAWYYFVFDGTFTLANGTPYCIVASASGTPSDTNNILVGSDNTSPTHGGNHSYFASAVWTAVTQDLIFEVYTGGGTAAVVEYDSPTLTESAATTNRLTGGTGSFTPGKVSEIGHVTNVGWSGNNYTEILYSVKLIAAQLAGGDTLRFRVLRNGSTANMTYSVTPTINLITGPANLVVANGVHTLVSDNVVITTTAPLIQEGFRWRNDDGTEATATWMAAQDTNAPVGLGAGARLRAVIDTTADTSVTPTLYYKKSTDSTWLPVPVGPGGGSPVYVATSSYIAAGGEATTALLTPPAGGTFATGRMWDDENGADTISIVSVFNPTSIAGCAGWFDAADTATITASDGAVSQWNDKSGNNRHVVQATAGSKPTTGAATINGKNVLSFNGSYLDYAGPLNTALSSGAATVFVVCRETVEVADAGMFMVYYGAGGHSDYDSHSAFGITTGSSSNHATALRWTLSTQSPGTGATSLGVYSLTCGSTMNLYRDGVLQGTSGSQAGFGTTTTGFLIGARYMVNAVPAGNRLNGQIAEILIYNSVLSTTDRQTVENYLRDKWVVPGPSGVDGLFGWFDAADDSSFNISNQTTKLVMDWYDKSPTGWTFHATGGWEVYQPRRDATVNGKTAVRFTNIAGDQAYLQALTVPGSTAQNVTQFIVCIPDAGYTFQTPFHTGNAGSSQGGYALSYAQPASMTVGLTYAWTNEAPATGIPAPTSLCIGRVQIDASNKGRAFIDGVEALPARTDSAVTPTTTANMRFVGTLCEVLHYERALVPVEINKVEAYLNTKWGITPRTPFLDGGTPVDEGGYRHHYFTSSGTLSPRYGTVKDAQVLVVAGGGAGGNGYYIRNAGGGGAGGVLEVPAQTISTNATVVVGGGGANTTASNQWGGNGSNSSFGASVAIGGGGGGGSGAAQSLGRDGGSGGGCGSDAPNDPGDGTPGQGTGGYWQNQWWQLGGGGGAGEGRTSETNGVAAQMPQGGDGREWPVGSGKYYGGGGSAGYAADNNPGYPGGIGGGGIGAGWSGGSPPGDGAPNTGGGGGGSSSYWYVNDGAIPRGSVGGTGIVIVRYPFVDNRTVPALAGLQGWYDASDASSFTYSSGTIVSQWKDKSGFARHLTQATVANQPNRNITINGNSAVYFDGNNDILSPASWARPQPVTIFMVNNWPAYPWMTPLSGTYGSGITVLSYSGPTAGQVYMSAATDVSTGLVYDDTITHTWTFVFNGASSIAYRDGVASSTLNPGTLGIVGGLNLAGFGSIGEVCVYDRLLTPTERQGVEAYLKAKWATP